MKKYHNVHAVYEGKFNTATGIIIDMNDLTPEMINSWDIAKGLAYTARFGGQTTNFYSVAQHSILVEFLAPPELKKAALLHDASEAYLGDVIKPLKVMLESIYGEIEDRFMNVIAQKFGVSQDELIAVKEFDMKALDMEHEAFQKGYTKTWNQWWIKNMNTSENIWTPEYAFGHFLKHWVKTFGVESHIINSIEKMVNENN